MLKPLGDRVLLRSLTKTEELIIGGIIVPPTAVPIDRTAEVLAVGPKVTEVRIGERVVFAQFAGLDAEVPGHPDWLIMSVKNIIAVL